MDLSNVGTVGIIGAGVAGLSTAKVLLAQGLTCTVLERNAVLGGVWTTGYSNFGTQVQRELYEFPDMPLPKDVPDFTPGPIIQRYLEDYARQFGLWPHLRFGAEVTALRQDGSGTGWHLSYIENGSNHEAQFDLVVVCIGLYSNTPHLPRFEHQAQFHGEIIHVSELSNTARLAGKKVAVVGFGKSATDAALESAKVAATTTIIFREAHWPVPPLLLGALPFKWAMLNRLTSTLIPLYYRPTNLERAVHTLGKPLVWLWWRLVELLLIAQYGLGSRFGTRLSLVPTTPIEIDAFGESVMLPRPDFYRSMRNGRICPLLTKIAHYTPTGLMLQSGIAVDADVVILATGWKSDYGFLSDEVRSRLTFEEDGLYLYRQMIHPGVPNLVFVGNASTIASILTYSLQARWLGELIKGNHQLPSGETMALVIDKIKTWKRKSMPFSQGRAARLLLHMQHYHDELLTDFGASPLRKTGICAPFKEAFAPYEPNDYRAIASGDWNENETR